MSNFNFRLPFKTKAGWPARLVGVLHRQAYPYVVAVWNPAFDAEELHCYGADGKQPMRAVYSSGDVAPGHEGAEGGALSLVNTDPMPEDWVEGTTVTAAVYEMPSLPPGSNPFHYDLDNMGTPLVRGWTAMHPGYGAKDKSVPLTYIYLHNQMSGQRIMIRFAPRDPEVKPVSRV